MYNNKRNLTKETYRLCQKCLQKYKSRNGSALQRVVDGLQTGHFQQKHCKITTKAKKKEERGDEIKKRNKQTDRRKVGGPLLIDLHI